MKGDRDVRVQLGAHEDLLPMQPHAGDAGRRQLWDSAGCKKQHLRPRGRENPEIGTLRANYESYKEETRTEYALLLLVTRSFWRHLRGRRMNATGHASLG